MKYVLIYFFAFLQPLLFLAQTPSANPEAEMLRQKITSMKDSPEKVDEILTLGDLYTRIHIDTAMAQYERAYILAKKIDYKEGIITYTSKQSHMYNLSGNFQKALEINQMGYKTALEINDKSKQISPLANMGIVYSYLNDYEKAIDHYHKALQIATETKDQVRTAKLYGILAGTYNNMGFSNTMDSTLFTKSVEFGLKALQIGRTIGDSILISDNLNVIALAYNNLERMDDAYPYALESKKIAEVQGLTNNYAEALSFLSKYARKKGNFKEALDMAIEATSLHRQLGSVMGLVINLKELALCYQYTGDYPKAVETINEAINIAESQEMDYILDGMYINKGDYLYSLKKYKDAYDFLYKGHTLGDSLRGIDIKTQINELEKKYETVKKEQKIQALSARQKINRWIITGLIFALLALLVIGYTVFTNIRYKTKILEQEKEQLKSAQKLQATASIIKGQEEERHRLAKDLHDGLGGMLSGLKYTLNNMNDNMVLSGKSVQSFDNAISMLDQAIAEMRKVAHNMMPESLLKFGLDETLKDYIAKMNASVPMQTHYQSYHYQRLEQSLEINLYRIIQEVINNAVKHAGATDLYIQLDLQDQKVNITMEDNGKGFDIHDENIVKGIGLKNIQDRVSYMNGHLEISSTPGKGTLYVLEIKIPES